MSVYKQYYAKANTSGWNVYHSLDHLSEIVKLEWLNFGLEPDLNVGLGFSPKIEPEWCHLLICSVSWQTYKSIKHSTQVHQIINLIERSQ